MIFSQVKRAQQAVKAERARQQQARAQQTLSKLSTSNTHQ
jgi:hypothetical protein